MQPNVLFWAVSVLIHPDVTRLDTRVTVNVIGRRAWWIVGEPKFEILRSPIRLFTTENILNKASFSLHWKSGKVIVCSSSPEILKIFAQETIDPTVFSLPTSSETMELQQQQSKLVYMVIWTILLVLVAWPLAFFVASIWVFLLPFEALIPVGTSQQSNAVAWYLSDVLYSSPLVRHLTPSFTIFVRYVKTAQYEIWMDFSKSKQLDVIYLCWAFLDFF